MEGTDRKSGAVEDRLDLLTGNTAPQANSGTEGEGAEAGGH